MKQKRGDDEINACLDGKGKLMVKETVKPQLLIQQGQNVPAARF